jgi:hypothetical protein
MLLGALTVVVMLAVAYAYWRQGLLTAVAMCGNVLLSGLIAFGLWEPLAAELDQPFSGTFLAGYEDCLCLLLLFCLPLGLLRLITNNLAPTEGEYPPLLQQGGSVFFALVTGYLVSGFLLCLLQTLPWQENFLYFDPTVGPQASNLRRVLPPDRVWLAMMHHAGKDRLGWSEGPTFDADGSFEARYARLRRYKPE